jgi:hypothetical protein
MAKQRKYRLHSFHAVHTIDTRKYLINNFHAMHT